MNRLVWKLLRRHVSIGQLTGFFLANLIGMAIVTTLLPARKWAHWAALWVKAAPSRRKT